MHYSPAKHPDKTCDMHTSNIESKIRNDNALSNLFKGCFSPSELAFVDLDPDKDHALILNTDDWPGQHWLSVFFCFSKKKFFVFESKCKIGHIEIK